MEVSDFMSEMLMVAPALESRGAGVKRTRACGAAHAGSANICRPADHRTLPRTERVHSWLHRRRAVAPSQAARS